ncbi:peptidoglycan DD-metalloendopeptidase family protein [Actinoplanes sp. NPDC026619]|uniref:M23 family metallopeptidase n=1 Tax=Actinoplanes sp. NPDC026619 TaxID=3155798 RepID=UPI003404AD93
MLPFIRKIVLGGVIVGLTLTAAAGCSGKPEGQPIWAGSTQGLQTSAAAPPPIASATPKATPSASASPSASATKITYTFPVIGKNSYAHTHHDYPASDVITACGHRFVAVTGGVVLAVTRKDTWTAKKNDGATRGGLSVSIMGDDGVRYYGSHLSVVTAGINPGVRVKTGQDLGKTGDSGDASACHLHFGISPPCAKQGDWWNQRGTLYPWPYLDSWAKDGQKSPVAAVKAWQKKNGCPTKPTADA